MTAHVVLTISKAEGIIHTMMMMMYKITHNLVAIPPNDYMILSNNCTRGHHYRFRQFTAQTNSYLYPSSHQQLKSGMIYLML